MDQFIERHRNASNCGGSQTGFPAKDMILNAGWHARGQRREPAADDVRISVGAQRRWTVGLGATASSTKSPLRTRFVRMVMKSVVTTTDPMSSNGSRSLCTVTKRFSGIMS